MRSDNKGVGLMIMATLFLALQDSMTKYLVQFLPVIQVAGIRYWGFVLFAVWWTTRNRPLKAVLRVNNLRKQILRGTLLVSELLLFAYAVKWLGLGQMHAIFATFPLIVTALSPWMLGEEVGWRRWLAVSIGFIGTLIIIAPGSVSFNQLSLLPLLCALMFAVYTLLTRQVSTTDSADASLLYTALTGAVILMPLMPFVWQPIPTAQIPGLVLLTLASIGGHFLTIKALSLTQAVILQPFNYLTLIWAILLGYLLFSEHILHNQWLGAALVVGGGIYIGYRQRRQVAQ